MLGGLLVTGYTVALQDLEEPSMSCVGVAPSFYAAHLHIMTFIAAFDIASFVAFMGLRVRNAYLHRTRYIRLVPTRPNGFERTEYCRAKHTGAKVQSRGHHLAGTLPSVSPSKSMRTSTWSKRRR